jgi:flagellar hook assembly protein FlgD
MTGSEWAAGPDGPGAPNLSNLDAAATGGGVTGAGGGGAALFTPNGDGLSDTLDVSFSVNKEAFVDFEVRHSSGNVVRTFTSWSPGGTGSATWDGRRDDGDMVNDGNFTITAKPRNRAGEEGATSTVNVKVLTTMRAPSATPSLFFASDGDSLASATSMSVNLTQAATFSWKLVDGAGDTVRSNMNNVNVGAGLQTWNWDGRDGSGAFVPDGTYYSVMTATTAAGTYSHSVPVEMRAFTLTSTVPGPVQRGVKVKYLISSAEPLTGKPKVRVFAPGLAVKVWTTAKVAGGGFQVSIKVGAAAQAGTVQMRVQGTDSTGAVQYTDYFFPLQ